MEWLKKVFSEIWDRANGNKTIFFLILVNLIEAGLIVLPDPWSKIVLVTLYTLTGGSAIHHFKKGYGRKDKGN